MHTLILRDIGIETNQYLFQVQRLSDGKCSEAKHLLAPDEISVHGRPKSNLSQDLRWYLEQFLDYPFSPHTDVAERVKTALESWGEQCFNALFGSGIGRDFYHDAYRFGLENLTLKIASDRPQVLAWPWEALRDPQIGGALAYQCSIERQLSGQHDPLNLPDNLPRERINILMITARPYMEDVGLRTLSRPLVELIENEHLPAKVEMLRPPTFDQLLWQLKEKPGFYHIIHFDGHGGYGPGLQSSNYVFKGYQGHLIFETSDGKEDPITAEQLSTLLRECRIPIVILNACQSAMIDERAENAFASVASALQCAGVRSVAAMAYTLYVSGARVFLLAFYRRLFEQGKVTEAIRAGRQAMFHQPGRVCCRGKFHLADWLVPVLYQQDPLDLSFVRGTVENGVKEVKAFLPQEIIDDDNPYDGFIGRDSAILTLERAKRRAPSGILIHGLAGVGKTTLAKGLVKWLANTGGLECGCFWFTFNDIRSSEYVFNRIVERLFGVSGMAAGMPDKRKDIVSILKTKPFLIVWDNFESVSGIPGTEIQPQMPDSDRQQLKDFLIKLRGGKTKVILTSRSPEPWLDNSHCFRLPLYGLQGEERWDYCNAIVSDLGLSVNQEDPKLNELMELLNGHPLMMRVVLTQLVDHSAETLINQLHNKLQQVGHDDLQTKLFATLSFIETSLPNEIQPLLIPLALHERFIDSDLLEAMVITAQESYSRSDIDHLFNALVLAGLLCNQSVSVYAIHPALTGFLRSRVLGNNNVVEVWCRAFVYVLAHKVNMIPDALYQQRPVFDLHSTNFLTAVIEGEKLGMEEEVIAITDASGSYLLNKGNLVDARRIFEALAEKSINYKTLPGAYDNQFALKGEAVAYHRLGMISTDEGKFAQAEQWFSKSQEIEKKLKDKKGESATYHELGVLNHRQNHYREAKQWYMKSLLISQNLGDLTKVATTYHQLADLAKDQGDISQAELLFNQSVTIEEKEELWDGAIINYYGLGEVAENQGNLERAKYWYRRAMQVSKALGYEDDEATSNHQLGLIAYKENNFDIAERHYKRSLDISERRGNLPAAARTYHQLGLIAQKQNDFTQAKQWYNKSLKIKETFGDWKHAAHTYSQLGIIAEIQNDFTQAEKWYKRSLSVFEKLGDIYGISQYTKYLGDIAAKDGELTAAEQWYKKSLPFLKSCNDELNVFTVCLNLGSIAASQNNFILAASWYLEIIEIFCDHKDRRYFENALILFMRCYKSASPKERVKIESAWEKIGLGPFPSDDNKTGE